MKNKKQLKEVTKEIQKLKEQLAILKASSKNKEFEEYQNKINQLLKNQTDLSEGIEKKEKQLQELEAKLSEGSAKQATAQMEAKGLKEKTASRNNEC
jgi:predicted  nucleic acid-binding Zn-ribbon protein